MLATGGRVGIVSEGQQQQVDATGSLPSGQFVVQSIEWDIYPGDQNTHVADADLSRLASLAELQQLDLWSAQITDQGLVALLPLKKLRRLQLSQTRVTDAGLSTLSALPNLTELGLVGTQVTSDGVRRFQRAHPDCKVIVQPAGRNRS